MTKITLYSATGEAITLETAEPNLMLAAVENGVDGILGDCGGVASCATCHVIVHPNWIEKTGRATDMELEILDFEDTATEHSRLGCQVELSPELDGLVVHIVND